MEFVHTIQYPHKDAIPSKFGRCSRVSQETNAGQRGNTGFVNATTDKAWRKQQSLGYRQHTNSADAFVGLTDTGTTFRPSSCHTRRADAYPGHHSSRPARKALVASVPGARKGQRVSRYRGRTRAPGRGGRGQGSWPTPQAPSKSPTNGPRDGL